MSGFVPLPAAQAPSFTGATLLYPQPSLANLAQLAADLLVHNCKSTADREGGGFELVGYFGLADFVPSVGGRDGLKGEQQAEGVAFGTEVYFNPTSNLVLLFPRSPVVHARRAPHLDALRRWVEESGMKEVLLVAGVDAALRGDEGITSSTPLRHFLLPSTPSASSSSTLSSRLASLAPPYSPSPSAPDPLTAAPSLPKLPLFPHGGLTRRILEHFALSSSSASSIADSSSVSSAKPTVAALTVYTFEGDAAGSAFLLADALAHVLQLTPSATALSTAPGGGPGAAGEAEEEGEKAGKVREWDWKTPQSWERGLMGVELRREAGASMFG
ncbi:hypothetical protein JCM8097_001551 [Rhodosporidiobolus ruineniae]